MYLANGWRHLNFWKSKEWTDIKTYLHERYRLGYDICPSPDGKVNYSYIFKCLAETSFDQVKIIIACKEPYYQVGLSDGLLFSAKPTVQKIPKTLQSIFLEYKTDLRFRYPITGDLSTWARNGILLMPTVWTIESQFSVARKIGHGRINGKDLWHSLTFEILNRLSVRKDKLVYILWGKQAQENRYGIDEKKHLVLTAPHPSPRNLTYTGKDGQRFAGCSHFSKACDYLNINRNIWKLP